MGRRSSEYSATTARDAVLAFQSAIIVRCDLSISGKHQSRHVEIFTELLDSRARWLGQFENQRRETLRMAIQVIVAGLGARGRDWLREIDAAAAFELAACVDSDPDVLERVAVALNVPRGLCFTSLQEAIQKSNCRAVIIATPSDCHGEPCETALTHGLAVMVEKPFTTCLSEAVKLVLLAEKQGVPLLVAQNYRYLRSFRAVRRLIGEGALGPIGIITSQYYSPPHDMPASLRRLQHSVLWGMGVHHLDALRYALGKEVISVAA